MVFKGAITSFPSLNELTLALLAGCLVEGVPVETPLAALAVFPLSVPEALQTSSTDTVACPHGVEIHVAVAVASHARTRCSRRSQGVTIVTILTHLTAYPCTQ